MNFRQAIFKIKDRLNGSPVLNSLKEIKYINTCNDQLLVKQFQEQCIKDLLVSTIKDVPFYQNEIKNEFARFPVVDKLIIKNHFNQFISVKYNSKKLNRMVTSGSTETPFVFYQDIKKKSRNIADTIYF